MPNLTKFKAPTQCLIGSHEWIVSRWRVSETRKEAVEFVCRFCMTSVDINEKEIQIKEMNDALKDS